MIEASILGRPVHTILVPEFQFTPDESQPSTKFPARSWPLGLGISTDRSVT